MDIQTAIPTGAVVVAISHCYTDNNGDWDEAHVWNGKEIKTIVFNGFYSQITGDISVNATNDQKQAAIDHYKKVVLDIGSNSRLPYVDCVVTLKRSRKAPNRTPLKIVGYDEGGYNSYYNQREPEMIAVEVDGVAVWVSVNCIDQVVLGKKPRWAN